jgi:hypothetical protein
MVVVTERRLAGLKLFSSFHALRLALKRLNLCPSDDYGTQPFAQTFNQTLVSAVNQDVHLAILIAQKHHQR